MSSHSISPEAQRPQLKKAVSFWSHFGTHEAVRKEFPEATCMGANFKHGLPAVDLWTLHIEPEKEAEYRGRFSPFVYDFKEDEPEVLVGLREILGELIQVMDDAEVLVKAKTILSKLIRSEEEKIDRTFSK